MAIAQQSEAGAEAPQSSGKKRLIILITAIIAIIAISIGSTIGVLKFLAAKDAAEQQAAAENSVPTSQPAVYYPLKPPLMVSFSVRGRARFVQAELTLMTRDPSVISTVELHQSMILNALNMLIGGQSFEELQTAEGKELLRQQCLQEIQRLLQKEIGKPGIEQVLFTSFVMQ